MNINTSKIDRPSKFKTQLKELDPKFNHKYLPELQNTIVNFKIEFFLLGNTSSFSDYIKISSIYKDKIFTQWNGVSEYISGYHGPLPLYI